MGIKAVYEDYPVGAQSAAMVVSDDNQPFCDNGDVMHGVDGPVWATLELGGWPLDGTRAILADDAAHVGWWSDALADKNGNFAQPPVITIEFPDPYTASGLTFTFDPDTEQYPTRLAVRWYNGLTLLKEQEYRPTATFWVLQDRVQSFDKIEIRILSINKPEQFAKIKLIEIGVIITFEKDELVSASVTNEIDPSLGILSVDSMSLDIIDRRGLEHAPQENQRITLYENDSVAAVQYIESSTRGYQRSYTFSCKSAIGLLEDEFLGGIYREEPLKALLDDVFGSMQYWLDDSFVGVTITGHIPVCTRREALQQICFAIGAVASSQGLDGVALTPVPEDAQSVIGNDRVFFGASMQTSARVGTVEIFVHEYAKSDTVDTLIDAEIHDSDLLFTFSDPHYEYAIQNGSILGSGANWVRIAADGNVKVTGKKYTHTTYRNTKMNPNATASEKNNTITVENATLVNRGNVEDVLKRVYSYYLLRKTLTETIVVKGEKAGQMAISKAPWGADIRGFISSMVTTYTKTGKTARITLVGVDVDAVTAKYYAGELFAGEGEVLY